MWNKVYLAMLAVGVVVAGFLAWYGRSWLQSIGEPSAAWEAFSYHKRSGIYFTVAWTVLLLVVGNIILWTRQNPWALWTSNVFFVCSSLTFLVGLHLSGITFCTDNFVCTGSSRAVGPIAAVLGILLLTALIFVNQFAVLRIREKMYGTAVELHDEPENKNSRPEAES